ncbi:MAG: hypothetical protein KAJ60_02020, partial [Desulfobulbaceae bacterium]|nr:hypothetical protein [Desulfobulbaceae bacterium]
MGKLSCVLFTLICLLCSGCAQSIKGKCLSGDCSNGEGIFMFEDGTKYEGQFVNNMPEGLGKFKKNKGIVYEGDFRNGQYEGQGTLYY